MDGFLITSILLKIGMALVGLFLLFIALRIFDKVADIQFREVFDGIESEPRAAALYLGCRFMGVCLVLAAALL